MDVPSDLLFTTSHEWVRLDGDEVVVGITDFAQDQLAELTFVDLPSVDDEVSSGDEVAVVESVKAASDVYAPVSGSILQVNERLESEPGLVNTDPYGEGWLFRIRLSDPTELESLLPPDSYRSFLPEED